MKLSRSQCMECPWIVNTKHNKAMINNIERLVKNGSLKTKTHRCHMISTNLWAETNDANICIGSQIKN